MTEREKLIANTSVKLISIKVKHYTYNNDYVIIIASMNNVKEELFLFLLFEYLSLYIDLQIVR